MADRPRHDAMAERESLMGRAMVEGLLGDSIAKVYRKIPEWLDAQLPDKILLDKDGKVVRVPRGPHTTEQRLTGEMVTKLADHWPNKLEHEIHGELAFTVLGLDQERV